MRLSLVAVVERREEGTGFELLKMRQCTDDLANFPSLSEIPRVTFVFQRWTDSVVIRLLTWKELCS